MQHPLKNLITSLPLIKKKRNYSFGVRASVLIYSSSPASVPAQNSKMAAMIRHVRQVKAAKIVAGLMGGLKVRPFCIVTPAPTLTEASALSPIAIAAAAAAADAGQGRVSAGIRSLEEEVAARRKRKRGGPSQVHDAPECKVIKEHAMFGLDQINQREHTNLELMRILGAWYRLGPGEKHDITLEATDGSGKGKFYRVGVTDLYMFKPYGYTKLELVQWELLDDPYPITYFKPETYKEYVDNLKARLESLRETPREYSKYWQKSAFGRRKENMNSDSGRDGL